MSACPACGATALRPLMHLPNLDLERCRSCGHTVARHQLQSIEGDDYHAQYRPEFADALERTRRRQSRMIAAGLLRHGGQDDLLDFGCGRGWFLRECRASGMRRVAGVDTSALAISLLNEGGIEGHLLPIPRREQWDIPAGELSFEPKILTLLDVIEHFDTDSISASFQHIVKAFPRLKLVLVKVPISSGLLYRLSLAAARIGFKTPLAQLYQQGTFPPHYHYFSTRSVRRFLATQGFDVVEVLHDADFDVKGFRDRVTALKRFPVFVGVAMGAALKAFVTITRARDSAIVIARPTAASLEYRARDLAEGAGIRGSKEEGQA